MKVIGIRKRCLKRDGTPFLATHITYVKETSSFYNFFRTSPAYKVVSVKEVEQK